MATACQQEKADAIFPVVALFCTKEALEHKDWVYGLMFLNSDQTEWTNQKDIDCLIKKVEMQ